MPKLIKHNSLILVFLLFLSSCTPDFLYAKYEGIENQKWTYEDVKSFTFTVENTMSEYQFFSSIRYGISYPYRNMYLQYSLLQNADTIAKDIAEVQLMDAKTGMPLGEGGNRIFYIAFPLMTRTFDKTGKYELTLRQYMRKDTLPHIYNVGLLIDRKVNE